MKSPFWGRKKVDRYRVMDSLEEVQERSKRNTNSKPEHFDTAWPRGGTAAHGRTLVVAGRRRFEFEGDTAQEAACSIRTSFLTHFGRMGEPVDARDQGACGQVLNAQPCERA